MRAGQWLAVWGAAGGLGSLAVQYAVAQGVCVLALDQGEGAREYATSLGAERYISTQGKGAAALAAEVAAACGGGSCGGGGAAHAIVLAPCAAAFEGALAALAPGGTCVAVALPKGGVPISVAALVLRGQRLIGSLVGSRLDMAECLAFSAKHGIRVAAAEVPLGAVNAAMADVMAGKVQGRIVLRIAPDSA